MNAGVRFIYDIRKREHVTPYLKRAHFLPVVYRIKYKLCSLVFKAINLAAPRYIILIDVLQFRTPTLRGERDSLLLEFPKKEKKTIYYQMCVSWNALPLTIRKSESVAAFKKELKTFYFKLAFENDPDDIEIECDDFE